MRPGHQPSHTPALLSGPTASQIGSAVAISGVFLYSVVDDLLKPKAAKPDAKKM